MPGKGSVQLTGKLGDVLKESVEVALSWVKAHAYELGLTNTPSENIMEKRSIHVHCPAGAIPKVYPHQIVIFHLLMCHSGWPFRWNCPYDCTCLSIFGQGRPSYCGNDGTYPPTVHFPLLISRARARFLSVAVSLQWEESKKNSSELFGLGSRLCFYRRKIEKSEMMSTDIL
jgi:hypothetical protein